MRIASRYKGSLTVLVFAVIAVTDVTPAQGLGSGNETGGQRETRLEREPSDSYLEALEKRHAEISRLMTAETNDLKRELEETRKDIKERVAFQMRCNEQAISSVNTSISGASYALTLFGIIVGIFGIIVTFAVAGLGIYIGRQVKKVTDLTKDNKSIYETHLKIRDDVTQLDANIKSNVTKLYNDLRKEETRAVIERLGKVPEDIGNLFNILASREIPDEFYPAIKDAWQLGRGRPDFASPKAQYFLLFFQHFAATALFDPDLADEIEQDYPALMGASFVNDIIRTSCEFLAACTQEGILHWRERVTKYFVALSESKHKKCDELHAAIYKTLGTKEHRFNLYSILSSDGQLKGLAQVYGKLLLNDYKGAAGNTESEQKVITEIAGCEEPDQKEVTEVEGTTEGSDVDNEA